MKNVIFVILIGLWSNQVYGQSKLDKVTAGQNKAYYFRKLKELLMRNEIPGRADSLLMYSSGKKELVTFLTDEVIRDVIYLNNDNCFLSICHTSGFPNLLYIRGESGVIDELVIGDVIEHIYIKEFDDYRIYFIYEYLKDQTREKFLQYFTIIQNKKTCSYTREAFVEWKESPQGSFSGPLVRVLQTNVEFSTIDGDFYILQNVELPKKALKKFKFQDGQFLEVQ